MSKKGAKQAGGFVHSVKGKIFIMGALGIAAAVVIGIVGVFSINKNAQSSEIVSTVNEINVLQSQNLANDALYQYYVDESYLKAALDNLANMEQQAVKLESLADESYRASVDAIIENIEKNKTNYNEILNIHSSRGYTPEIGKYQEYMAASADLGDSFGSLVNNNDWVEIEWQSYFHGTDTPRTEKIDGKDYFVLNYNYKLPEVGKRNSLIFRLGGTFDYKGDYYIKGVSLSNGSEEIPLDLGTIELSEKSGAALVDAEMTTFGDEPALKVSANYTEANGKWEEISTAFNMVDYSPESYPILKYDLYLLSSAVGSETEYKYGGAVSGVYGFSGQLGNLNNMIASYSKLVVEGKDVAGSLSEIEALMAEIQENIPKYTTDPSLADASNQKMETLKSIYETIKATDATTLEIKAGNAEINSVLSSMCATVQNDAVANMNGIRTTVTILIIVILIASIVVLTLFLARIFIGINRSVNSFSSAIEEIATGKISTRANASGRDEFALFAESLNEFMDTLEGTIIKVKKVTDVLAESGVALENSAAKTKTVAGEINSTIEEISKGAGEQAKDIESSSQQVMDIRSNIMSIVENVNTLSGKSSEMSDNGKVATDNMNELTRSSDYTTEAFGKIVEQVKKTDESVGKIQEAVSLIATVADQINLLSLNASIEAARAGDAGKGFAVVASEISNLADQTNQSTAVIEDIIRGLSEESNRTVETIFEVTGLIENQKESINSTGDAFSNVSHGIDFTRSSVSEVLNQAEACENASEAVADLMTNLSAISEENAASAETTSVAMTQLNEETTRLAETSEELMRYADELQEDLKFFEIAE